MITIDRVTKSHQLGDHRRHLVFSELSLNIPAKKNTAILGVNGAGKSTLLRMIGGIDLPDSGSITMNGKVSPPLGLQGGVSGQLSGLDNAKFICRIQGDSGATLKARIDQIEAFAELGKFFREPVRTYSSGMRARLAFACSVAFSYDYLLVDELTSVGDQGFREKANKTFQEMRGKSTLIIVSHNLQQLKQQCDGAVYLKKGSAEYFDDINVAVVQYKQDQDAAKADSKAPAARR